MNVDDIKKKVFEVLSDKACVEQDTITLSSSLVDDLGMDSLDAVEMLFEFEEQYGIEIPDEDVQEFKKVQDIVSYLEKRLLESPPT